MGKIGLITIHDTRNYGSLAQTLGLYKMVESFGKQVDLIDYKNPRIAENEKTYSLSECKNLKDFIKFVLWHKKLVTIKESFWAFMNKNMSISKPYTKETVANANDDYDCYLVGSDIVWGTKITGGDYTYMLDFVPDGKKKIAFSSSVGTKWDSTDEIRIKELLQRFDNISVREKQAAEWVENLVQKPIPVTCDPSMLQDITYWNSIRSDELVPNYKYVLVYMADSTVMKYAQEYSAKYNLKVVHINPYSKVKHTNQVIPDSLGTWIGLIANAECVFTSSYHGTLFSLYFNKQFFYFNLAYKSRLDSLATEFGFVHREGTEKNILADVSIDYGAVNKRIKEYREYSINVLSRFLS